MTATRPPSDSALLRLLVAVAAWLQRPLAWWGVQPRAFLEIVTFKLRLDFRQVSRGRGGEARIGVAAKGGLVGACVLYLLIGFGVGGIFAAPEIPFLAAAGAQALLLYFVGVSLLADFTNVLLDPTDLAVLAPRPVTERTLLAARIVHVALYLGLIAASIGLGPLAVGTVVFGPRYGLGLLLTIGLTCIEAVFGTILLYLLAIRLVRPGRLRGVILWVQMGTMIVVMGIYMLMPRALHHAEGVSAWVDAHPLLLFVVPPFHMAGLVEFVRGDATARNALLAASAVVLPALMLWGVARAGSRGLLAGLADLETQGHARPRRGRWGALWRRLLARGRAERGGFDFFRHLAGRERQYQMRTYPMLALMVLMSITISTVLPLYYAAMFFAVALLNARYTETPEARWIFHALPVADRAAFHRGALWAYLACVVLPIQLVLTGGAAALGGTTWLPHILFATAGTLAATLVMLRVSGDAPFFVRPYKTSETSGLTIIVLVGFTVSPLGVIHFLLVGHPGLLWAGAAVLLAGIVLLLRSLARVQPSRVEAV